MTNIVKRGNRALFHHRDSTGRNDQTPGKYVEWAAREANQLGLLFNGSPEMINQMILSGQSIQGDIYLDFDVKGNELDRPALSAFVRRLSTDSTVSHVFIPRRDRLARPDDAEDAMRIEKIIRRAGVTIHFQDKILKPLSVGQREEISETIMAAIDYNQAGAFRRELSAKMIQAQRNLGEQAFSTGGRPPFFLRRWLTDSQGHAVRELIEGEIVRMKGHHVAWLPSDDASLQIALRIVNMLEKIPATQVARTLTLEGVPSPDANRTRTDNGIEHRVSGAWNVTTIVNTVRSMYLVGKAVYGRRSMGDQQRYSPTGPRDLQASDMRDDGKPKVIRNPESDWTIANARFAALVDPQRLEKIIAKLDERGKSQRGKPRSKDPANNPLGTRVFDMACGWRMYREPYSNSFRYKCGAYSQSSGAWCSHNHVPGPQTTSFALQAIRQRLLSPNIQAKLRDRLESLSRRENSQNGEATQLTKKESELTIVRQELNIVEKNLARARSDEQYKVIEKEFELLKKRETNLSNEIARMKNHLVSVANDPSQEIEKAMQLMDRLSEQIAEGEDMSVLRQLFDLTNTRLFLRFETRTWGKRKVQKLQSGIITFGATPPPIEIYQGNTGRHALKEACERANNTTSTLQGGGCETSVVEKEENSLGNVSRGNRTPLELFCRELILIQSQVRQISQLIECCVPKVKITT